MITVIRHAEKPKNGPHLSNEGVHHAKKLPEYFKKNHFKFRVIIAMKQHADNSNRPFETVEYVAKEQELKIINKYERDDIKNLVIDLKEMCNHQYFGDDILICWEHNRIVDIIRELTGITIVWQDDDYSSVYHIDYHGNSITKTVMDI